MIITVQINREFGACYTDELLAELYGPHGKTYEEVATLRDDKWVDVPLRDRIWILQHVLLRVYHLGWLKWLATLTERSLARVPKPDPRSVAVVAALRADALTQKIVDAAYAAYAACYNTYAVRTAAYAAYAAYAADTAYVAYAADTAVYAAVDAAIDADADADVDAAADAERQTQLADLVELLKGK